MSSTSLPFVKVTPSSDVRPRFTKALSSTSSTLVGSLVPTGATYRSPAESTLISLVSCAIQAFLLEPLAGRLGYLEPPCGATGRSRRLSGGKARRAGKWIYARRRLRVRRRRGP